MTSTELRERAQSTARTSRRLQALLAVSLVFGLVLGTLGGLTVGPHTPALGDAHTGDEQLAADVRAALISDRGYRTLSVGRVRAGTITFAGLGEEHGKVPTPQTLYELGSVTKTFTGMLLADAVARREMTEDDRLAQYLPELAGTPAGEVTLFELATQSSGLPPLPPDIVRGSIPGLLGNANPYQVSAARVIEATRSTQLRNEGRYAYSNLGMTLLGHAEARAAGLPDWPTLATQRILQPLGMTSTIFAATAGDIPAGAIDGHQSNGWPAAHWYGPGFTPAGSSTWTNAEDMTRFAAAVLANKAPGMAALESKAQASGGEIGYAWQTMDVTGREITWHDGGTGGMRSMLALDRKRQQAVVILGNTNRDVDRVALALAASNGPIRAVDSPGVPDIPTIAGTLAGLLLVIASARQAARGQDRLRVAAALAGGAAGLLLLLAHGPWVWVPAWVWGPLTGAWVALAGYAVLRSVDLPIWPGRLASPWRRRWQRVGDVLSAAASLLVLGFAIWSL